MTKLQFLGNITTILQGQVTFEKLLTVEDQFLFALGGSTVIDEKGIGETIVLNKKIAISYFDQSLLTVSHLSKALSPFLMGVSKEAKPDLFKHIKEKTTLDQLYTRFEKSYAFVANIRFSDLQCTFLKKAPIYHESVLNEEYWEKAEHYPNVIATVFGIVLKDDFPKKNLERGFYQNPQDQVNLLSHSHAALHKHTPELSYDKDFHTKIRNDDIIDVRHVLTQSTIQEGIFSFFELDEVKILN